MTPRSRRKTPHSHLPLPQRVERQDRIVLDHKAYFLEFCKVHGEPVESGGRLIFRDGWSYSAQDYEGPEWGPPADTALLDEIVTKYWVTRLAQLSRMLLELTHRHKTLKEQVDTHSLPLQQSVMVDTEQGTRRGYRPLSLKGLESKIEWVRCDVLECETRLKELEEYRKQQTDAIKLKEVKTG